MSPLSQRTLTSSNESTPVWRSRAGFYLCSLAMHYSSFYIEGPIMSCGALWPMGYQWYFLSLVHYNECLQVTPCSMQIQFFSLSWSPSLGKCLRMTQMPRRGDVQKRKLSLSKKTKSQRSKRSTWWKGRLSVEGTHMSAAIMAQTSGDRAPRCGPWVCST